ncbi:hypothetical protein BDC45DRAFT_538987 [Circinella umbellata]|nr:hypothetical protein BDC45DRAFT_538987 [Circinella umbellata]
MPIFRERDKQCVTYKSGWFIVTQVFHRLIYGQQNFDSLIGGSMITRRVFKISQFSKNDGLSQDAPYVSKANWPTTCGTLIKITRERIQDKMKNIKLDICW